MGGFVKDLVIKIITPYLGKSMAEASIELFCKKRGMSSNHLTSAHIPELAEKLKPGFVIFVGNEKAEQVMDHLLKIR